MGVDARQLETIWSGHPYPGHITFVAQWEEASGLYFRILRDGDTLLVQGLYPALGKGAQTRIEGSNPDSERVYRTVKEAVRLIVEQFKQLEATHHGP